MPKKITQNVNKDKFFNDLPQVRPEKSTWLNRWTNYQASYNGDIVPIYYSEVLPKEERKVTLGMISHTTTPVAPIFPAQYTELRAFWVPARLCADLLNGYSTRKSPFVKVFGEDNKSTSADIIVPLANQKLPSLNSFWLSAFDSKMSSLTINDNVFDSLDLVGLKDSSKCNFLNLAAYELIYQRHYRNENFESSTASPLYQALYNAYNDSLTPIGSISNSYRYEVAPREKDYFTGSKPFTLKASSPVQIPIGDSARVIARGIGTDAGKDIMDVQGANVLYGTPRAATGGKIIEGFSDSSENFDIGLYADLKTATGISIEDLRVLVKTQELLEKDAMYGSMYAESLNSHFGCCPLDTTLQDPQELYRTTITSNMQAIFQTSSTSGESSILGTIGANSTTQTDPFVIVPKTKFLEHGILMICMVHKLQNVYDSTYFKPKFLFKQKRFDFYTPELNDLGYQPISYDEATSMSNAVVSYNEAFAEYRYTFNRSHGSLNKSFAYWAPAISNEYSSAAAMYKEDTEILDKALSIDSSTAPQFYDAWGFEEECTKPMSLHSIPGFDGVI